MKSIISIILPVFNEGEGLASFVADLHKTTSKLPYSFEVIIVDDGSCDNTWEVVLELSAQSKEIKAIQLSRNFGKEYAIAAGLDCSQGDACIVMDADGQHPLSLLPEFIERWGKGGIDIVRGVKRKRQKETFVYRLFAKIFYSLMLRIGGINLRGQTDYNLISRRIIDNWKNMQELHLFFRGMITWLGFKSEVVYFEPGVREYGDTKWGYKSLLKLGFNALTSYTAMPLQIITFFGSVFSMFAVIVIFQTLYKKFFGEAIGGFTTVIILQLSIGSLLMVALGIIGQYIAKIYDEIKKRPRYVIKSKIP